MDKGWLRARRGEDDSLEVWAPGWRLEARALPLLPLTLAIGFLYSPAPIVLRALGALALGAVAIVCQRLTRIGLRITANAVTIVNLRGSYWVPWRDFMGFVGERSSEDGRCVLVRKSGDPIPLSGSLDAERMNPEGEEGDLSAIDELNRAVDRFRREITHGPVIAIPPVSPGARRLSAAG
ncbi:MAG TPA: hypothetical protein VGR41_04065 [Actinomycetota bacterium]|jgi:hypothetical protein|nr:hypothetical protein [Actinomycetota bacterium]